MSGWKSLPKDVPVNGSTCYVRIYNYYSSPFEAVYNSSSQLFTSVDNAIIYPVWTVTRWQYV